MSNPTGIALPQGVSIISTVEVSDKMIAAFLFVRDERAYIQRYGDKWNFALTEGVGKALNEVHNEGISGIRLNVEESMRMHEWLNRQQSASRPSASATKSGAPRAKRVRLTGEHVAKIDELMQTNPHMPASKIHEELQKLDGDTPSYQTVNKYVQGRK